MRPAMPPLAASTTRARCPQCQRAALTCICAMAQPVDLPLQVLLLQHPMEVQQAKGTGRLLQLSLRHSRLIVGECLEPASLQALLHAPWDAADSPRQAVLLYPASPAQGHAGLPMPPPLPQPLPGPQALRLVVLDATWRKSRKMLYLNPLLHALPRLALQPEAPPRYAVLRKAQATGQLSTLEATAQALVALDPSEHARHAQASLYRAMDALLAQHDAFHCRAPAA